MRLEVFGFIVCGLLFIVCEIMLQINKKHSTNNYF